MVRFSSLVFLRRLAAALLLAPLVAGCFQLREPEPATGASEWLTPTSVDILVSNFTTAVQNVNTGNYERSFVGARYRFVPDPTSAGSTPALFANWSVTEELNYFTSLRRRTPTTTATPNSLVFSNRRDNFYTTDSAEVSANYQLRIAQTDTAFHARLLEGNIRLLVRFRNNEWKIAGWTDQRTGTGACWTDLKKYFISH